MLDSVVLMEDATTGMPGGERIRECIARWARPLRVDVAGRPGVGKSTIIAALGPVCGIVAAEVHGVDSPDIADATFDSDLLIYVVVRQPHPCDLAALASRNRRDTVVVLAKADTLTDRVGAAAATASATSLPTVSVDSGDVLALRSIAESTIEQLSVGRARRLRADVESAATAEPSLRESVERFLAGVRDRR